VIAEGEDEAPPAYAAGEAAQLAAVFELVREAMRRTVSAAPAQLSSEPRIPT